MPQARAKAHWHYNFKFNNMKLNGAGPVQALRPGLAQPAGMGPSRPDRSPGAHPYTAPFCRAGDWDCSCTGGWLHCRWQMAGAAAVRETLGSLEQA